MAASTMSISLKLPEIACMRGSVEGAGATTSTSTSSRTERRLPRESVSEPRSRIARARRLPRKPAAPVMTMRIRALQSQPGGRGDRVRERFGVLIGERSLARLDHHPKHRLGARRPQQHASRRTERRDREALRLDDGLVAAPIPVATHRNVDQSLREERHRRGGFGERRLLLDQRAKHRERCDRRIAGRVLVEADDMTGVLASELPALLDELLQYIAIADLRAQQSNPGLRQRLLQAQVAHERANHTAGEHAAPLVIARDNVQELIAIVETAFAVGHHQTVAVAVERDAEVGTVCAHLLREVNRVRRADAFVDVDAVGLVADGDDVRAKLVKHGRRDVIRGAVRAIDDDLATAQVELVRERALAELDVTARRVADAKRLAEFFGWRGRERTLHLAFDRELDVVGELRAARRKELDAVVVERIVRRADDNARRQPKRARQIGDRGRGQRATQVHVDAGGRQARLQRRFEQIAGNARVLANEHCGALAARAIGRRQRAARRPAKLQDQVGRDRGFADAPANAVGAEVVALPPSLAAHRVVSDRRPRYFQGAIAFHAAIASTVSRTSCTRSKRAPRTAAASATAMLPARRSPTSCRPVIAAIVDLRDAPTSTGKPEATILPRFRNRSRLCASVLPKPKPGSTTMR